MREIKFRGKRVDNGEWVYGYYRIFFNSANGTENHFIANDYSETEQVVPETVGQFTGLTDKNGKEIYEGDVVKRRGVANSYVEYYNGEWVIRHDDEKAEWRSPLVNTYHLHREIIGNLHDNPELFK